MGEKGRQILSKVAGLDEQLSLYEQMSHELAYYQEENRLLREQLLIYEHRLHQQQERHRSKRNSAVQPALDVPHNKRCSITLGLLLRQDRKQSFWDDDDAPRLGSPRASPRLTEKDAKAASSDGSNSGAGAKKFVDTRKDAVTDKHLDSEYMKLEQAWNEILTMSSQEEKPVKQITAGSEGTKAPSSDGGEPAPSQEAQQLPQPSVAAVVQGIPQPLPLMPAPLLQVKLGMTGGSDESAGSGEGRNILRELMMGEDNSHNSRNMQPPQDQWRQDNMGQQGFGMFGKRERPQRNWDQQGYNHDQWQYGMNQQQRQYNGMNSLYNRVNYNNRAPSFKAVQQPVVVDMDPAKKAEMYEKLCAICQRHQVEDRTLSWFLMDEHAAYWEPLLRKASELDARSGGVQVVKNPSAWLTKYFNILRNFEK